MRIIALAALVAVLGMAALLVATVVHFVPARAASLGCGPHEVAR